MAIKKIKGTFKKVKDKEPAVIFDPKAWSTNIEMKGISNEIHTHIFNVRRCWNRGAIADMIWNAEMAEIKINLLREYFEKEK